MSAKLNKIELSEEFMVMWREEQTLWDVMSPSYRDQNERDKSFRSSHWKCSLKKVLLEILQSHRKTPLPESFLIKLQTSRDFKEHLLLQNTSGRLLQKFEKKCRINFRFF